MTSRYFTFCFISVLLSFSFFSFLPQAFATPSGLTFQGRLAKDGTPVSGSVTLTLRVASPNSDLCTLFEESHTFTIDPSDDGVFSVVIGSGSRTASDKGFTIANVFSNTGTAINGLTCPGTGATSYTPLSHHARYIFASFNTNVGVVAFNDPYVVQSVPYAIEAEKLAGRSSSEYLQTTANTTQTKINDLMVPATYTELLALLGGTSSQYMTTSNSGPTKLPVLSSTPASPSAGQIWYESGVLKYYDGASSQTKTVGTVGGAVSSIATGTGLTGGPITTTGTLAVDVGTTTGKIVQVAAGDKLPTIDGSNLTNVLATGLSGPASTQMIQMWDASNSHKITIVAPSAASLTSDYTLKLPPTVASSANQVLTSDTSGNLSWTTPAVTSALSVTSPITNTGSSSAPVIGIQVANTSQSGYLSSTDWNNFNSKQGTSLTNGNIWIGNASGAAASVTPSGDATISNTGVIAVNKIKGVAVTGTPNSASHVLKYDGTSAYVPSFIGIADIRSTATGNAPFFPTTCTSSQTLTWSSIADVMSCTNISVSAANFSNQSQNTFFAGPSSGGSGAPSFRTIASADLPTSGITAGTYNTLTVDTYGRATSGSNSLQLLPGTSAQTFGMQRNTNAGTAGQGLTIDAGGSIAGTSDLAGGDLTLRSGISTGTGSSNIHFQTSTAGTSSSTDRNPTTKMTILGSGEVGIGLTNPSSTLHVQGGTVTSQNSTSGAFRAFNAVNTSTLAANTGSEIGFMGNTTGTATMGSIGNFWEDGSGNLTALTFSTRNTSIGERMRINSAGFVGIATNNPQTPLHVMMTSSGTGITLQNSTASTTSTGQSSPTLNMIGSSWNPSTGPKSVTGGLQVVPASNNASPNTSKLSFLVGVDGAAAQEMMYLTNSGNLVVGNKTTATQGVSGGQIQMTGYYNGTSTLTPFATISSYKEDTTAGNDGGYLSFSTNVNGTVPSTEKLRIASSGYVGINQSAPRGPFEVQSVQNTSLSASINSSTTSISVYANSLPASGTLIIDQEQMTYTGGGTTTLTVVRGVNSTTAVAHINGAPVSYYGPSTLMVSNSGNVGVGTTSPMTRFHLSVDGSTPNSALYSSNDSFLMTNSGTFANARLITSDSSSAITQSQFVLSRTRGTLASPTAVANGDFLGNIVFQGYDGTNRLVSSSIQAYVDGAVSTNAVPSAIMFSTTNTSANFAERMRITSAGFVGIGLSNPSYRLDVAGDINTSTCFRIGATIVSGTCASDERLKENISDYKSGLSELLNVKLHTYTFNGLGEMPKTGQVAVGVIAQELEKTNPELVKSKMVKLHPEDEVETEIRAVDYSQFSYMLINAVKELYKKWFDDHTDLQALKNQVRNLEESNAALKAYICEKDKQAPVCH